MTGTDDSWQSFPASETWPAELYGRGAAGLGGADDGQLRLHEHDGVRIPGGHSIIDSQNGFLEPQETLDNIGNVLAPPNPLRFASGYGDRADRPAVKGQASASETSRIQGRPAPNHSQTGSTLPFIQVGTLFQTRSLIVGDGEFRGSVERHAGVAPDFVEQVELQVEVGATLLIEQIGTLRVRGDATADFQAGLLRRHATPHQFDGGKATEVLQIGFAASGTAAGPDFIVDVESRTDDR